MATEAPLGSSLNGRDPAGGAHAPNAPAGAVTPLLSALNLHKHYGGVRALDGANLTLSAPGTVHALVGENGSGKSTMLSILSGQARPDSGAIRMGGEILSIDSPKTAIGQGIVMVSQETALALELSVAENVFMGRLPRRAVRGVDFKSASERTQQILARLGMHCDPGTRVGALRPDQRQMVEIARALAMEPRVLILDEPTSSLTDDEVSSVLDAIRLLKDHDVATILVTHRLDELFAVCDEVTILRDGKTVAAGVSTNFTPESMVATMLGDAAAAAMLKVAATPVAPRVRRDAPALELRAASGQGFRDVSFEVQFGEVVGLAGLVGSGRGDLLRSVFGLEPLIAGSADIDGVDYRPSSPRHAISRGIGFVPPERKTDGLVLTMTVRENLAMVATASTRSRPGKPRDKQFKPEGDMVNRLRIRLSALDSEAGMLSGGNQQKVVLAKWLTVKPKLLMLDEPTRGVDVGSRAQIHAMLRELAHRQAAVLVSSSENPELLEICDRILVMFAGRIIGSLQREEFDETRLAHMTGGRSLSEGEI